MNDFTKDLEYSKTRRAFWEKAYRVAFPNMIGLTDFSNDLDAQSVGIDTEIMLPLGGRLYIDEKMRRKDYGDMLIEYIGNDRTNAPGWVEKPLQIDFIGYAFTQSNTVLFVPFDKLQELWRERRAEWITKYKPLIAKNSTYNTVSLAVPFRELSKLRIIKVVIG